MRSTVYWIALGYLSAAACVTASPINTTVVKHRDDTTLEELAASYWEHTMASYPTWATDLGDRRFDSQLEDLSATARRHDEAFAAQLRERLHLLDAHALSESESVSHAFLDTVLEQAIGASACQQALWEVDQLWGIQVRLAQIPHRRQAHQ